MERIDAVFETRAAAERAHRALHAAGIPEEHLAVLAPGAVPSESAPAGSQGSSHVGAVVGGAAGASALLATGVQTGVFTSLLVPGVGPVLALGVTAAGILGPGGAAVGAALGASAEAALRSDDKAAGWLFHYEECLRQGRSIVVVTPGDAEEADRVRAVLAAERGEPVHAARERWWRDRGAGLGGAGGAFRHGFEAAQAPDVRGRPLAEVRAMLVHRHRDIDDPEFRRGYEQGLAYRRRLDAGA